VNETTPSPTPPAPRGSLLRWLAGANSRVAGWAASLSWGRLVLLFLLAVIVGAMLASQLNLRHDRVATRTGREGRVITIDPHEGIRIVEGRPATPAAPALPSSAAGGGVAAPAPPDAPGARRTDTIELDADDDEPAPRRVWTFRGLLGDLGRAGLVLLFAYLAAAKIVVGKVAQADAKVRDAEGAASREALQRQLVQARLQLLQAQVEPHFLFNTLAAVDFLIETDPPRASEMQKKLITYLRGAMPQMRQESSTLGRELKLACSYLDLIKMRIEERLEIAVEVPPELEAADFPPMMLQSLVENAIRHGIEPKAEGGTVTISARQQRDMLWVEVRDTGGGIADPERLESPAPGSGIGLQNIREGLALLYPGKGRLMLMSDEGGTRVRIGIEHRTAAAEPQPLGDPWEASA
jgi:signal transduction histidine kinase